MKKYVSSSILLVLSLLFIIGEQTVAGPCPVMLDGRFMVCHWAGQAVLGVGIVLVVLSLLHLAFKNDGMKLGLDLAVIANAVLLLMIPNRLIPLCIKNHMRCHTVMEPFVLVMGVLMIAAALGDFFFRRRVVKKEGRPWILTGCPGGICPAGRCGRRLSSCLPFSCPLSFLPDP